jgi:hypothetical protein
MTKEEKGYLKKILEQFNSEDDFPYQQSEKETRFIIEMLAKGLLNEKAFSIESGDDTQVYFYYPGQYPLTAKGYEEYSLSFYDRLRESLPVKILRDLGAVAGLAFAILESIKAIRG